jgi:hypothetical protein
MAEGWTIIFEGQKSLRHERHLSGWVHKTYKDADRAQKSGTQVGNPLGIVRIEWDDTNAQEPWPSTPIPRRLNRVSLPMVGLTVVLLAALGYSVCAVAKLENYRYANFVGLCADGYDVKSPTSRIKREDCLMRSEARSSWWWNAAYGLGLL